MAKKTRIRLKGSEELVRKLKQLAEITQGASTEGALRAGAMPIETRAKELAPYQSGSLRRSIHTEVKVSGASGKAQIGTDLIYAAIQEFGGTIAAKNAPYLTFQINGRWVRVPSVEIPARPYMRPAFDEKKSEAVNEIAAALRDQIKRVG